MNSGEGKVVCVTGASGFIASWLVKMLLERGYTVRATVRNINDPSKVAHLQALDGAKERLHLFEADLLKDHCFDLAVEGCDGVFHTASPVLSAKSKEELVDPALKGTLNILRSCAKSPSVRRVVMTSSMAAVMFNRNHISPEVVVDETWFSDPQFFEETKQWYPLSKTLAEEAAWEFAKDSGIDLVTICPGFVIGPMLQPTLNLTSECFLNLIKEGKEMWPNGIYRYVDVRDVADSHIRAFEVPSANGRYCVVGITTYSSVASKILHKLFPSLVIHEKCKDELPVVPPYQVSKERAKSLGINFTSLELSLKDTVEILKKKNLMLAKSQFEGC